MRYLMVACLFLCGCQETAEAPPKHFCTDSCTVGGMKPLPIAADSQRFILVDSVDWVDKRMMVGPDTLAEILRILDSLEKTGITRIGIDTLFPPDWDKDTASLTKPCLYSTEAEVCAKRGHTPSTGLVAIWDNEYVCKYCGTHFYIETKTTQREWGK